MEFLRAERFAVVLAECQNLLIEPVGILLGENDIGLEVHANLLIAGGGAIVKLYNRTTTHLLSGSSRLAAWLRWCGGHHG
jgi:hypothetical protein